jgi:pimeloyl-ACP methyl ester carboxylesterase
VNTAQTFSSDTADTQLVETSVGTFAYRRFGRAAEVPLVMCQRFRGTLKHWDPALLDGLARDRELILFDNIGVNESTGAVPATIAAMAEAAGTFIDGLGLSQVDLLGWSMGGFIVQALTLSRPELVRRLIIAASGPGAAKARGTPLQRSCDGRACRRKRIAVGDVHGGAMTTRTHPVDRFLAEISAGRGITTDTWTDDARLDATVPNWRLERSGAASIAAELSQWYPFPTTLESAVRRPIPGGEAVELDLSWVEDGVPHAGHQMHVLVLDGDRISAHTIFCGGRWSATLLAEMEAARVH